ncbi:MAG: hypothetical protein AAFV93_03810, partial [Chloroflexota bacterium]
THYLVIEITESKVVTMRLMLRWTICAFAIVVVLSLNIGDLQAQNTLPTDLEAGSIEANPNYYYDHETAFIIAHAIDRQFGGVYMALRPDGSPVVDLSTEISTFWGVPVSVFGGNHIQGTEKSLFGLGTCIRYFIQEYQRTETLRLNRTGGVAGINAQLVAMGFPNLRISAPSDLLGFAQSCADFITDNMIINPVDDGVFEDPFNAASVASPWIDQPDIGDVVNPDRVYYWSSVSRNATDRFVDDTLHQIAEAGGAPRAEGIVPWSMAELALVMQENGIGGWQTYRNMALDWWNWRQTTADPLPDYNDTNPPDPNDSVNEDNCGSSPPNRCLAGGARDVFYPALSYILNILAGQNNPSGAPYEEGYIFGQARTPDPTTFPFLDAIEDGAYLSGYARGVVYANVQQRPSGDPLNPRFENFGNFTVDNTTTNPNPARPFTHFAGREWLAGTQRAHWFYHTFPTGTGAVSGDPDLLRDEILRHWRDSINTMWDDIVGQEAWFESSAGLYKPCFSAGTDMPIGDWLAPSIGEKLHNVNPSANSFTVTVYDVVDEPFAYMSWEFDGIGIADDGVQVAYTLNPSASSPTDWEYEVASNVGDLDGNGFDDYQVTITLDPTVADVSTDTIYYYARAIDDFSNVSSFPAAVDNWSTAGDLISQAVGQAQVINGPVAPVRTAPADTGQVNYFKTVTPSIASVGDEVTWTVIANNDTTADIPNFTLVDSVPPELDILEVSSTLGTVAIDGQDVILTIDNFGAGQSVTVIILTRINDSGRGTVIVNQVRDAIAQVISIETLPNTGETPAWHPCSWIRVCN